MRRAVGLNSYCQCVMTRSPIPSTFRQRQQIPTSPMNGAPRGLDRSRDAALGILARCIPDRNRAQVCTTPPTRAAITRKVLPARHGSEILAACTPCWFC